MKTTFKKIVAKILIWQSKLVLRRYRPKIVAITGSVGKTTTKDAIFIILSKFKSIRKSQKSFNSEIGLPLTILGCPNGWSNPLIWLENFLRGFRLIIFKCPYPEWLVLEVGVGKPGDIIKNVAPWLCPDIVVITRFPDKPVHVEFFGSAEKIIEEKSALALSLKENGLLVLNHDDEKVYALHQKVKNRVVSCGASELATYRAVYETLLYKKHNNIDLPDGLTFKLEYQQNVFPVVLPHILGQHFVYSALAALAVAHEIGCDLLTSIKALAEYQTPPGRLSFIEGLNNSIIIDDTYNSSPVAMEAALEVLKTIKGERHIAVLGDMLELGKLTEKAHNEVGHNLKGIADKLVIVGPRAKFISDGAISVGFDQKEIYSFDDSMAVGKFLKEIIRPGDVILLKGSQGVRLERAILPIMAHPEQKDTLLCRQEKDWLNRP